MATKIGDEWVSVFFTGCKIKVGGSFFLQFAKKVDKNYFYFNSYFCASFRQYSRQAQSKRSQFPSALPKKSGFHSKKSNVMLSNF